MNIFYKNFNGSLMKTTNIGYKTLPGLRPAAWRPQEDTPGTAVGPGAIPVIKIVGLRDPEGIRNLISGIWVNLFQRYRLGGEPQERHEKIGFQESPIS
jgi:hypothetical protein